MDASEITKTVGAVKTLTEQDMYLQLELLVVLGVLIVLGITLKMLNTYRKKRRHRLYEKRGERMNSTQKAVLLKQIVSQGIHDGLFEAWHRGEITQDEYMQECTRYANIYDLGDLLPRQRKLLKTLIRDRVRSAKREIKPLIPGDPPVKEVKPNEFDKSNVVNIADVKKNSFMSSFMDRVRKAS